MNPKAASNPPPGDRPSATEILTPGILAGMFGAVVMALFAMIVAAASGHGFFAPMKLIAATFLGPRAMDTVTAGAAGAVILGIAIHLILGAVFGVVWAAYLPRHVGVGTELGVSLLYGALVFLVMTFLIMPWADPTMWHATDKWWLLAYNLAYGLSLVVILPIRREVQAGVGREAQAPA